MSNNGSIRHFEEMPEIKKAEAFMKTVEGVGNVDYGWVMDYSKDLWKYRNSVFDGLEGKAEAIVKYLGGGTGLFTLGVLAKVDASNVHVALWTLPAVACALFAVVFAIMSKRPAAFPSLPTIEVAKSYADGTSDKNMAVAAFLGQLHLACEKARVVCALKATLVARANVAAFCALVALVLPMLVALTSPPTIK